MSHREMEVKVSAGCVTWVCMRAPRWDIWWVTHWTVFRNATLWEGKWKKKTMRWEERNRGGGWRERGQEDKPVWQVCVTVHSPSCKADGKTTEREVRNWCHTTALIKNLWQHSAVGLGQKSLLETVRRKCLWLMCNTYMVWVSRCVCILTDFLKYLCLSCCSIRVLSKRRRYPGYPDGKLCDLGEQVFL